MITRNATPFDRDLYNLVGSELEVGFFFVGDEEGWREKLNGTLLLIPGDVATVELADEVGRTYLLLAGTVEAARALPEKPTPADFVGWTFTFDANPLPRS